MLDEISATLHRIADETSFATKTACRADDLRIEVKGVGRIRLPVSAAEARKLCAVGKPAPFGWRDETHHDESVRKTWEIARRNVKIDTRSWNRTLAPQLEKIRSRLGMPEEGGLRAVFHKMLVYEPGHFFVSHQDSEKADDMLGSLVVVLPSQYSGGSVVIEHGGARKVFRRSATVAKQLSLIAFYADCRHEVKPVESGYRIALTYHLVLEGAPRARTPAGISGLVENLASLIEAHFAKPPPPSRYATSPPPPPDRLVFLLDHEYTQRSLGWGRLKNADRLRAGALREAAERLGCEIYLALADVHESWSCESDWGEDYGWSRRRRYHVDYDAFGDDEDGDDDDGSGAGGDDYNLTDLIESEIELLDWVGLDGRRIPSISSSVGDDEVCSATASVDLTPYRSEHPLGQDEIRQRAVPEDAPRSGFNVWPRHLLGSRP